MKKLLLAIVATFVLASLAFAHPGGLDAYGGHVDKSTGKYHVHKGPLEGRTYNNQENMLKVLKKTEGGPEIIKNAEQKKSDPKKK